MTGLTAVGIAFCAAEARADPGPKVIRASERMPISLVLYSPTKEFASATRSQIQTMADAAAAKNSDFFARLAPDEDVATCAKSEHIGRLTCFVQKVRSDYADALKTEGEGAGIPVWGKVKNTLRKNHGEFPRYAVVISGARIDEQTDRLVALLIDTMVALEFIHQDKEKKARSEGALDHTALEDRISEFAVKSRQPPLEITSPQKMEEYLEALFNEHFKPIFESSDNWQNTGAIELKTEAIGAKVTLDDKSLDVIETNTTRIEHIRKGPRKLAVSHPDYEPFETIVEVKPNEVVAVDAFMQLLPSDTAKLSQTILFWSGVAVAALGAGFTAYSLVVETPYAVCVRDQKATCPGSPQFIRFGADGSGSLDPLEDPNGGGIPIAPFGYSLLGMGTTWAVGTGVFGDDERLPWLEFVVGVAVAGLAFGISMAADGENAVQAVKAGT